MQKNYWRSARRGQKKIGCREFASDCQIDNIGSLRFHKAMKFAEANRIICFTKEL